MALLPQTPSGRIYAVLLLLLAPAPAIFAGSGIMVAPFSSSIVATLLFSLVGWALCDVFLYFFAADLAPSFESAAGAALFAIFFRGNQEKLKPLPC